MVLPDPKPGLVIDDTYLWDAEQRAGREDGVKDRPCVIVIVATHREGGALMVTVAPITHSRPRHPGDAVEIPARTKARLGLDDARS